MIDIYIAIRGGLVEILIIILLCIAILLFLVSFLKKDSLTNIENTIDELSLQHVQDVYQLKKRIRILEEELLSVDNWDVLKSNQPDSSIKTNIPVNAILKNQVLALYQQGISIDDISKRSTLQHQDIIAILKDSQAKGL